VIRDVLAMARKPVVVSHTGVRGTCDRSRNLTDDEVRAIAAKGGLIGIGFWSGATCGSSAKDVARAMRHAANLAGADHVSLGSDFDGDRMPFDATGLVQITDALLGEGFSVGEIRKIMGDNVVRFLMNGLPE
jgi:microsomal dipeptidase-like Zn-dependent dipeptidase